MSKVFFALDVDSEHKALSLVKQLVPCVGIKIGNELAEAMGSPQAIKMVHEHGGTVFRDAKLHDIPNTVAAAIRRITGHNVAIVNIMAHGGPRMLLAAREAVDQMVGEGYVRPLLLAVTVLTSLNQEDLGMLHFEPLPVLDHVRDLARLAQDCGLDGVVASVHEAGDIREACGPAFEICTPAISAEWAGWTLRPDQKRTATHLEAKKAGATKIVVGRAISAAPDPVAAAQRFVHEFESAGP